MADVHVRGLSDLQKFLDTLPGKIQANVLRGSLRVGMNTVKPAAQQGVRSISGELAKKLKVGTRARGGTVTATLKATGVHAFIGYMLEFTGAKPHQITAKVAGALSVRGRVVRSVNHPGFKKRPFMRPALDGQASAAVIAAAQYMRQRLATKHGLDTAEVRLDGDEQ